MGAKRIQEALLQHAQANPEEVSLQVPGALEGCQNDDIRLIYAPVNSMYYG